MSKARNRPVCLGQAAAKGIIDALAADLKAYCANVITKIREDKPYDYFRIIISLLPKEFPIESSNLDDMTDEELEDILNTVRSLIAARLATSPGEGDETQGTGSSPQRESGILCEPAPHDPDQAGIDRAADLQSGPGLYPREA
jgi:hypothetical protein